MNRSKDEVMAIVEETVNLVCGIANSDAGTVVVNFEKRKKIWEKLQTLFEINIDSAKINCDCSVEYFTDLVSEALGIIETPKPDSSGSCLSVCNPNPEELAEIQRINQTLNIYCNDEEYPFHRMPREDVGGFATLISGLSLILNLHISKSDLYEMKGLESKTDIAAYLLLLKRDKRTPEGIKKRVVSIIAQRANKKTEEIYWHCPLSQFGLNYSDICDLRIMFMKEFCIGISEEELGNVAVGDVIGLIKEKLNIRSASQPF